MSLFERWLKEQPETFITNIEYHPVSLPVSSYTTVTTTHRNRPFRSVARAQRPTWIKRKPKNKIIIGNYHEP